MSFTHKHKRRKKSRRPFYIPKEYQQTAIEFGVSRACAGFFLAPGLGKTSIILFVFRILKRLGLVDELLVLAKRRIVFEVWPAEISKWRQLRKLTYTICHGKDKEKNLLSNAHIKIANYEGLSMLAERRRKWQLTDLGKQFFRRRNKNGDTIRIMLAVDESSKLRHTKTQRFKLLKQCLKFFARRYILTGSPVPNGLMNLFGQVYTLDMGEALGKFITVYRGRYFQPQGFMGRDWALQKGADKRIFKRLRKLVIRYGNDQLNLPPLTFVDRYVNLDKKTRKLYDMMEKEYIAEWKGGEVTAANAAVASGKCRQIAQGGVYYDPDTGEILNVDAKKPKTFKRKKWKRLHDEKCEELVELLEELNGEPALVAFEFEHDKLRLQRYFKKHARQFADAPFVGSGMKDKEFHRYKKMWDNGELPVMFGQPGSIAHGLNLQGKGGIVIFFALSWDLENYEQFIQRVWRQGQTRRVIVYRIVCRRSVDEDMIDALARKDHTQQTLLKAMERRTKPQRLTYAA